MQKKNITNMENFVPALHRNLPAQVKFFFTARCRGAAKGGTGGTCPPVSLEGAPRAPRDGRDKGFAGAQIPLHRYYAVLKSVISHSKSIMSPS